MIKETTQNLMIRSRLPMANINLATREISKDLIMSIEEEVGAKVPIKALKILTTKKMARVSKPGKVTEVEAEEEVEVEDS